MSYQKFQELSGACFVTRSDLEELYEAHPHKPWSSGSDDYTDDKREKDAASIFHEIFGADDELDLQQLSTRISAYRDRLMGQDVQGSIWATIGNIRTSIAKAAATSFHKYLELLPDHLHLDIEEIREQGKPSPYGDSQFPTFVMKPGGGTIYKGTHPADYQAAASMYEGNLLALLIAREYNIEEFLP